jgi:hypothetical protein
MAALAAVALAADWEFVGADEEGNRYSVDLPHAGRDGSVIRVQVRTEYAKPRRVASAGKDVFVALDRMAVDCAEGSFAVEARTYVAADGTDIPRGALAREDLRFRPAAAGSMSETIVRFVCKPQARAKGAR